MLDAMRATLVARRLVAGQRASPDDVVLVAARLLEVEQGLIDQGRAARESDSFHRVSEKAAAHRARRAELEAKGLRHQLASASEPPRTEEPE